MTRPSPANAWVARWLLALTASIFVAGTILGLADAARQLTRLERRDQELQAQVDTLRVQVAACLADGADAASGVDEAAP